MGAREVLHQLEALGVSLEAAGDKLRYYPASKVPPHLVEALRQYKGELLASLRPVGDGQPPPLDRPPQTETELRRLIDYLANPQAFAEWLERLMRQVDPAESDCEQEQTAMGAQSFLPVGGGGYPHPREAGPP